MVDELSSELGHSSNVTWVNVYTTGHSRRALKLQPNRRRQPPDALFCLEFNQLEFLTYGGRFFFSAAVLIRGQLGNYLGALSNWVKLQKSAEKDDILLFSIVGWHALTLPQDPATLRSMRDDMLAILLAIGLDPGRSVLFHQNHVRLENYWVSSRSEEFQNLHHMELFWALNCLTPVGKLHRMTTWKVCK